MFVPFWVMELFFVFFFQMRSAAIHCCAVVKRDTIKILSVAEYQFLCHLI